jgi:hypothetical protein
MRYLVPTIALLAALTMAAAAHAPAAAQAGVEVRLSPRAGMVTPADWFYVEFPSFGAGPMEWTESAIIRSPVLGLVAEVAFEPMGLWVRAEALRTMGGQTAVIHAYLHPASQAGPGRVIRTRWDVPSSLTMGTVDLALPLRLRLPFGLQPYVTAGVGAKRYTFDLSELEGREERIVRPSPGTVPVANVGGGFVLDVRGWRLDVLVRDAMSEYWDVQQHDITFLAGVSFRVR